MPKTSERSTGSACSQPIVCKVRQLWAAKIALWPMLRWSRTAIRQSGSMVSAAPELRQSAATAASAASGSHTSIARTNSSLARCVLGRRHSSTGSSTQSPSLTSCACDDLKLSRAQSSGSSRSLTADDWPSTCAELMTITAWNLNPTGRGLMLRMPARNKPGEQVLVRESLLELNDRDFDRAVARGLLDQAHDRLDLRAELDHLGLDLGIFGPERGDRPQVGPRSRARHPTRAPRPFAEIGVAGVLGFIAGSPSSRLAEKGGERRCVAPSRSAGSRTRTGCTHYGRAARGWIAGRSSRVHGKPRGALTTEISEAHGKDRLNPTLAQLAPITFPEDRRLKMSVNDRHGFPDGPITCLLERGRNETERNGWIADHCRKR